VRGSVQLIEPYGGRLVDLVVRDPVRRRELTEFAASLPSVKLSVRSLCDLEMLATGAFSPLDRFMGSTDYLAVVDGMRLSDGRTFPIPVTLPVPADAGLHEGMSVTLRGASGEPLAVMHLEETYAWDFAREARSVLGTEDPSHPTVAEMRTWPPLYASGRLEVLRLPAHSDFRHLRRAPEEVRAALAALGRGDVVAFQTRNPMHRAHEELTRRAAERVGGTLLIHPVVGMTKPGDVDAFTRVRCYEALVGRYFDPDRTLLSLLPLAMRMAGPREAVWHAIIRRNYGVNHLIVGRDHASPGQDSGGRPFYDPLEAQRLLTSLQDEVGVRTVTFDEMVYLPDERRYEERTSVAPGIRVWSISGTQLRRDYLAVGRRLPS
jgi:sulfate adenylyltransferase